MPSKILISGAGIAGCCLAWWLQRSGHSVTIVEHAPEARGGGYVIDFWGLGYDVAEKMGLLDELRRHDLDVHDFEIVDRSGRKISGFNQDALKDLTRGRIMSLPRSVVALSLYQAIRDRVPVRFGDSIVGVFEVDGGVDVRFDKAPSEKFDLVVGADGLHSAVRRNVFGNNPNFERFLGYCVAASSANGYAHRDPHTYVTYGEPGRQIWRITLQEDLTVFLLVFAADQNVAPLHDPQKQKEVLSRLYAQSGWESQEVLDAMRSFASSFVPKTALGLWGRNTLINVANALGLARLLFGAQLSDRFQLPTYP